MTNVAVVVLDTMRKDVFDEHFEWLPGRSFENAYTTGNYTVPAHASLFGGFYPSELGVHAKSETMDAPQTLLAEQFRDDGYTTRMFSANPLVSHQRNFDRGFDETEYGWHVSAADPETFDWETAMEQSPVGGPFRYPYAITKCAVDRESPTLRSLRAAVRMKLSDDDGAERALNYLRSTPFGDDEFLFMNLMEAHGPYWPPEEYDTVSLREKDGQESETVLGGDVDFEDDWTAYNDCVRYLSDMYREMFDLLQGAFDYVITLGDHGEMFGEYGASAHYHGVYQELINVPVSVWGDDVEDGTDDRSASVLDVHRTVLDITGVDGASRGHSLLKPDPGREYLAEYLGFRPHRLDILRGRGFDEEEIGKYDRPLRGVVLPDDYYGFETTDHRFVDCGETDADPEARIEELADDLDVRQVAEDEATISEGARRHLEQLGYA
jgi:arylsulfatase A-like enzyme